jgi:Zn-dependent protease
MLVALAGPASNFALAIIFGFLIRFGIFTGDVVSIIYSAVFINILLGLFNLIPIPPLDGSKVLPALLPKSLENSYNNLMNSLFKNPFLGFFIIILLISVFDSVLIKSVSLISKLIIGV